MDKNEIDFFYLQDPTKQSELDKKYLFLSDKIAALSKDRSTKVGAVIIDEYNVSPISFGYNGMPRGLDDNNTERNERPEKYFWYEHAERNAIYNAARDLLQDSIMFTSYFPNMESARAIVSTGIKTVVIEESSNYPKNNEEEEIFKRVRQLFKETGVVIESIDLKTIENILNSEHSINNTQNYISEIKKSIKYSNYLNFTKEYGIDFSHDLNLKVGTLILQPKTLSPIASGFNGLPYKFQNIDTTKIEEKDKFFYFEESEKTAIFNAVRPKFKNSNIYVSWCPCCHCARAIASVGIKKVVTRQPDFNQESDLRWKDHFDNSMNLFSKTGLSLTLFDESYPDKLKNLK
jgi:dCMP deaminase